MSEERLSLTGVSDNHETVTKEKPSLSESDVNMNSSPGMASLAESWAFLDQELDKFQKICAELEREITTVDEVDESDSSQSINGHSSESPIASNSILAKKGPPPPTPPKPPSLGAKPKPPLAPKPKLIISSHPDSAPTSPAIQTNL